MNKIVADEVGDRSPKSLELGDRVRLANGMTATVVRILTDNILYLVPDDALVSSGTISVIIKEISRFVPVE